jgi:hypothetical protein
MNTLCPSPVQNKKFYEVRVLLMWTLTGILTSSTRIFHCYEWGQQISTSNLTLDKTQELNTMY